VYIFTYDFVQYIHVKLIIRGVYKKFGERRATIFRNLKMRTLYQSSHSNH